MLIYHTPAATAPNMHAIRTATTGVHARITCTCGNFDTGPVPGMVYAEELQQAHAAGTPIQSPVRPLLLANLA